MATLVKSKGASFVFSLRELSGALGDLGTLLPLMLGSIAVVGLAPLPVLAGFAIFYIATAAYYRLPIPVQPMKAVAVVLLTAEISPAALAVSGVMMGAALLLLGLTGWITQLARIVPQSVLAGLQLGLGLALALVSLDLMATAPLLAAVTLGVLLGLLLVPRAPSALIALVAAIVLAQVLGVAGTGLEVVAPAAFSLAWPSPTELEDAVSLLVLPQLSLTFTNAVLLTALVAGDYFGERAAHVTPKRLSISSGLANLLLTPLGALPMCHGAGGLAAHYRFGARSGTAPSAAGPGAARHRAAAGWPGPGPARRHSGRGPGRAAPDGRRRVGAEQAAVRLQAFLLARDRRDGGRHALGRPVLGPCGRLRCGGDAPCRDSHHPA